MKTYLIFSLFIATVSLIMFGGAYLLTKVGSSQKGKADKTAMFKKSLHINSPHGGVVFVGKGETRLGWIKNGRFHFTDTAMNVGTIEIFETSLENIELI